MELYISGGDAFTETDRLVRLGKVSIRLTPNLLAGASFSQVLDIYNGNLTLSAGEGDTAVIITCIVDGASPTIAIRVETAQPCETSATFSTWRLKPAMRNDDTIAHDFYESADVVTDAKDSIEFYHRNETSVAPVLARLEVPGYEQTVPDPYLHRTFGGRLTVSGGLSLGDNKIASKAQTRTYIKIVTHAAQVKTVDIWRKHLRAIQAKVPDFEIQLKRTRDFWNDYWSQSWLFVGNDKVQMPERPDFSKNDALPPSITTQAYLLTKFMNRCAIDSAYPLSWAGALFAATPVMTGAINWKDGPKVYSDIPPQEPSQAVNPDGRMWNWMGYLWQNIRLPYESMAARGESQYTKQSLFDFYKNFAALDRARAKLYWNAEGQHSTEMVTACGLQPGVIYGPDRKDKPMWLTDNRWGGAVEISPGLERLYMMLEVYDYTQDDHFLKADVLPYAEDLFKYIFTRFKQRENGKAVISPLHAVETYFDVKNPMPTIAGMHACLKKIIGLAPHLVSNIALYREFYAQTPELPTSKVDRAEVLLSADGDLPQRTNVETPETYAIFPFRLYGLGRPDLPTGIRTFVNALTISDGLRKFEPGMTAVVANYGGWQQTGMNAALLGLDRTAQTIVSNNSIATNPNFRFPAMWGPVYDAVPDTDHGANLLTTMQLMAIQTDSLQEGGAIRLLPAWPREWDVKFKLMAPANTTVTCVYKDGAIVSLNVVPASRLKDIVLPEDVKLTS